MKSFVSGVRRSSVKVKLRLPEQGNHPLTCGVWVTSSSRGMISPDYRQKRQQGSSMRPTTECSYLCNGRADSGPQLFLQCGRPPTCSCCWGEREQFLPTGGTLGQGWSSFAKKGTWVPWQKAEGCPDLCVHFQKHLILDQILSAVLKLGQWMGNACWPGWLGAPTEGAGAQPGASLQLASWAFSHGQREYVIILILRALQKLLIHLFWSFCLLEFLVQMGNEWWWCRTSDLAQRMRAQQGSRFLTTIIQTGP